MKTKNITTMQKHIAHAIQFLSNELHFSSPGAKAEAKELIKNLNNHQALMNKTAIAIEEALDHYVECNCGDTCNGTCTHSKLISVLGE